MHETFLHISLQGRDQIKSSSVGLAHIEVCAMHLSRPKTTIQIKMSAFLKVLGICTKDILLIWISYVHRIS